MSLYQQISAITVRSSSNYCRFNVPFPQVRISQTVRMACCLFTQWLAGLPAKRTSFKRRAVPVWAITIWTRCTRSLPDSKNNNPSKIKSTRDHGDGKDSNSGNSIMISLQAQCQKQKNRFSSCYCRWYSYDTPTSGHVARNTQKKPEPLWHPMHLEVQLE